MIFFFWNQLTWYTSSEEYAAQPQLILIVFFWRKQEGFYPLLIQLTLLIWFGSLINNNMVVLKELQATSLLPLLPDVLHAVRNWV